MAAAPMSRATPKAISMLLCAALARLMTWKQIGAKEGHWDRSEDHPAHQSEVHRPLAKVDGDADRSHHHCRYQVARDGCRRGDSEQQDQHGGHERAATSPGHTHQETHNDAPEDHVGIYVHARLWVIT